MFEITGLSRAVMLVGAIVFGSTWDTVSAQEGAKRSAPNALAVQNTSTKPGEQVGPAGQAVPGATKRAPTMQRFEGVWVEGPGFEVTYGGNYDGCAKRCLANDKCVMIEYYRPEKKCNLYSTMRPRLKGGSSDVAIRG